MFLYVIWEKTLKKVHSSHGKIKGICIGNSFMVSEYALENIVAGIGAYFPLRSVVGIVKEKYTVHKDIEVLEEYL